MRRSAYDNIKESIDETQDLIFLCDPDFLFNIQHLSSTITTSWHNKKIDLQESVSLDAILTRKISTFIDDCGL